MSSRSAIEHGLGWLYDQINGEEDARVCKDIPDECLRGTTGQLLCLPVGKCAE